MRLPPLLALTTLGACAEPEDGPASAGGDDSGQGDVEALADVVGCVPGAEAWGEEGQPLAVTVGCTGGGDARAFDVPQPPVGATWDPATRTLTWTPGLADAGTWEIEVVARGDFLERGKVVVQVADAWADPANVPVDATLYHEEFGLPVLHLARPDATNSETDTATTLVHRGHTYAVDVQYHGASSLYYPKKSYGLSFAADDAFSDPEEGFDRRRKLILVSTFDDNSYLRQALCYRTWAALDPERHALQTMFAVVYTNGVYEGLYLVVDQPHGEFWEEWGYSEDGDLYKSISHEANFRSTYGGVAKSSWHAGYEKKEGPPYDWATLDTFVEWAATTSDAEFAAGLEERFALEELIDWWILVRFAEADDSGGKNAYLYVDPATGLFHHAPWDFNHSFGQTWQTERQAASYDYDFFSTNYLFERALTSQALQPVWEARMRAALDGPLSVEALMGRIDEDLARIEPSAARDWSKWGASYQSYGGWSWRTDWTTHDEEIAYLRAWVRERWGHMDGWYPG